MDRLERIYRYEQSCEFLPHRLKSLALSLPDKQKERVEELRLRVMHPLTVLTLEGELNAAPDGRASLVTAEDLEQMLGAVTEYSRYACIETLRQGFLPLRGGFRLGVCGSAVVRDGEVSNLKDISSLALRIVCEHIGLGSDIAPQLFSADGRFLSTLILSSPGSGKTTLLRDLIRVLSLGDSEHRALRVAVIDERCELAVCCKGRAQMELGNHTDVLSLCPKAVGIPMVLRGMNPQWLAVDEITQPEDLAAIRQAGGCGVRLLATIHAGSVEELENRPLCRELFSLGIFRQVLYLDKNRAFHAERIQYAETDRIEPDPGSLRRSRRRTGGDSAAAAGADACADRCAAAYPA